MRCPISASLKNMTLESCPATRSIEASRVDGSDWRIATRARISSEYDSIEFSWCTRSLWNRFSPSSCTATSCVGFSRLRTRLKSGNLVGFNSPDDFFLLSVPQVETYIPVRLPTTMNLRPPVTEQVIKISRWAGNEWWRTEWCSSNWRSGCFWPRDPEEIFRQSTKTIPLSLN